MGKTASAVDEAIKAVKQNLKNREALETYALCYRRNAQAKEIVTPEEEVWYQTVVAELDKASPISS